MNPRVLILCNEPILPAGHPDAAAEHEIIEVANFVRTTLRAAGFEVSQLGIGHEPWPLLAGLEEHKPDVVFNLFEGTGDGVDNESAVASLLEWLGIPFTGCPAQAIALAHSKPLAKRLFKGGGLPTADFIVVEELPLPLCPPAWPVFVKPAAQDASLGIDQGSVVTDEESLVERVGQLLRAYGPPVLVEEYVPGREINVAVVETPELRTLPIGEILFLQQGQPGYWPILTYEAKWHEDSAECKQTPPRCPADVDPVLAERLRFLAVQAFRLLGCRDYARVDFRVKPSGEPVLLEVNPNPGYHPTAGFARMLNAAGLTQEQFTVILVQNALARKAARRPKAEVIACGERDLVARSR